MVEILILGAGITGLSTANFLKKKYAIAEKLGIIGGVSGSVEKLGFIFDYGEKFIRIPDQETENFLLDLMKGNFFSQNLDSAIYFKKTFINFPFQENLRDLPFDELIICAKSVLSNYFLQKDLDTIDNFEDFICKYYGDYIANEFLIPYNSKIWTVKPSDMDTSWFLNPNFIPIMDLDAILKSLLPQAKNLKKPKK